jgi:hypothetical protein
MQLGLRSAVVSTCLSNSDASPDAKAQHGSSQRYSGRARGEDESPGSATPAPLRARRKLERGHGDSRPAMSRRGVYYS